MAIRNDRLYQNSNWINLPYWIYCRKYKARQLVSSRQQQNTTNTLIPWLALAKERKWSARRATRKTRVYRIWKLTLKRITICLFAPSLQMMRIASYPWTTQSQQKQNKNLHLQIFYKTHQQCWSQHTIFPQHSKNARKANSANQSFRLLRVQHLTHISYHPNQSPVLAVLCSSTLNNNKRSAATLDST